MSNVIHIFGASGSGTSTLGKKICDELGYRFMDSDDYYWLPTDPMYSTPQPIEERIELMKKDIESSDNVVISGSLVGWGDELIPMFTLAIRVVTSTYIRLERIRRREQEKFGERIAPGGELYEKHQNFLKWAGQYDTGSVNMRSKANHDEWQKHLTCRLITIDGAEDIEISYQTVLKALRG